MHARVPVWLARNVRQLCGLRGRGMRRDTVRSEVLTPSLSSSPWMRGAPQPRFSVAIRRIKLRIALDTRGRPGPRDLQRQNRRKPRRCQPTTVSGRTMTRTSAQCAQMSESHAQKILSPRLSWIRVGFGPAEHQELLAERKVLQSQVLTGPNQRAHGC